MRMMLTAEIQVFLVMLMICIFIYIKRWQSAESDKHKVFSGKSSDCNGDGGRGDDDDDGDGGHGDDDDNDVGGVGIRQVHRPHESLAILRHSFLL